MILLQKRATVRTLDYFWHPLMEAPFSLGIALPQDYGRYRVKGLIEVALAKANCESTTVLLFLQSLATMSLGASKTNPTLNMNEREIIY